MSVCTYAHNDWREGGAILGSINFDWASMYDKVEQTILFKRQTRTAIFHGNLILQSSQSGNLGDLRNWLKKFLKQFLSYYWLFMFTRYCSLTLASKKKFVLGSQILICHAINHSCKIYARSDCYEWFYEALMLKVFWGTW